MINRAEAIALLIEEVTKDPSKDEIFQNRTPIVAQFNNCVGSIMLSNDGSHIQCQIIAGPTFNMDVDVDLKAEPMVGGKPLKNLGAMGSAGFSLDDALDSMDDEELTELDRKRREKLN